MRPTSPVRVVVVEDSLMQRAHLVRTLEADGDIRVVGEAEGALEAVELVTRLRPDVVTLDLHIPEGGGDYAIAEIMATVPTPILVLSGSVETRGSDAAVRALVGGAVEALPKPARWTTDAEAQIRSTVRTLRGVTVIRHRGGARPRPLDDRAAREACVGPVVALAASTGGPSALAQVLAETAGLRAPILIVQHIHAQFVDGLVDWMRRASALPVRLATDGERLLPGHVYLGPGDHHLKIDAGLKVVLDPEPVTVHRPSADELFASLARHAGPLGVGVVLTGMGADGAAGLRALRAAGGATIAQDEATSAVFGMPRAAIAADAVGEVVALDDVAAAVRRALARIVP